MTLTPDKFPWASYTLDAWQRSVLFLDVLRQRSSAFLGWRTTRCPRRATFLPS